MRIVHVIADGLPGGGTTIALALSKRLISMISGAVYFISQSNSYAVQQAKAQGCIALGVDFFASKVNLPPARQLKSLLAEIHPDLVHIHGTRAAVALHSYPVLKRLRPLVYTVHGYHFLHKPILRRQLGALIERRCHSAVDASVWVCEHDRQLAQKWHLTPRNHDQRVIHNGIRLDDIRLPAHTDDRLIAFLGRLHRDKNPHLLLEIIQRLAPKDFRLKVIGGGELEPAFRLEVKRRNLQNSVTVTGALPRQQALQEVSTAAYLILPSRSEGLPIAPMEAMYLGIPVVASRAGGTGEVVKHGHTGFLVDQPNADLYAEAILTLATHTKLWTAMSLAGRQHILDSFSEDGMFLNYWALYTSLLQG